MTPASKRSRGLSSRPRFTQIGIGKFVDPERWFGGKIMALVTSFEADDRHFSGLHPTELACRYVVGRSYGQRILQLNSYGSEDREFPDKLSQTLQLNEQSARQLFDVLRAEFGF
jgi:hypothetical protein